MSDTGRHWQGLGLRPQEGSGYQRQVPSKVRRFTAQLLAELSRRPGGSRGLICSRRSPHSASVG